MKIGVIGAGAFGFAMASRACSTPDNEVTVWAETQAKVDEFNNTGALECVLGGIALPKEVKLTASMEEAVGDKEIVLVLPAAAFVESVCKQMVEFLPDTAHVIIGSKGACPDGEMPAAGAERALGRRVATMGGPGFAVDILAGVPVGWTLATEDDDCFDKVCKAFAHDSAHVFERSNDTLGIEFASCFKNVAAIAMGALEGAQYPITTQCLLLQRVMSDLGAILTKVKGGNAHTAMTLAGLGDMVLTCFSPKSRNCSYGRIVGEKGVDSAEAKEYLATTTVEGVTVIRMWDVMSEKLGIHSDFMDVACKAFSEGGKLEDIFDFMQG